MTKSSSKRKCQGCGFSCKGTNDTLVTHMISNSECSKLLLTCMGCGKKCANDTHLTNHQKSVNKFGQYCLHGYKKLEHVQTLTINNAAANHQSSSKKRKLFSIEQPMPKKPKEYAISNENHIDMAATDSSTKPLSQLEKIQAHFKLVSNGLIDSQVSSSKGCPEMVDNPINQKNSQKLIGRTNQGTTYITDVLCNENNASDKNNLLPETEACNMRHEDMMDQPFTLSEGLYEDIFNITAGDEADDHIDDLLNSPRREQDVTEDNLNPPNSPQQNVLLQDRDDANLQQGYPQQQTPPIHNTETSLETQYLDIDINGVAVNPLNINPLAPNNPDGVNLFNNVGANSKYIYDRIKYNQSNREQLLFSYMDKAFIDLYNTHRKCRAPVGLFDETMNWIRKYKDAFFESSNSNTVRIRSDLPSRKTFIKHMYEKVYSKEYMQKARPKLVDIVCEGIILQGTVIDLREVLADLLSNQDVVNNLLFYDASDPTKIHPRDHPEIGEIITSDVMFQAHTRLCTGPLDVAFPLVLGNDEVNFDKYGKLQLDPISLSFGRLPVHIRNQPWAWRYIGIVHSIKQFDTDDKLDATTKMKIYHQSLKRIFASLKEIQNEGGIPFDLPLRDGTTKCVNLKIYIQFCIGDTKGHDNWCGRMGSHCLGMSQHLRDCCVTPNESDNPQHKCSFRKVEDVKYLETEEEFRAISFKKIDNFLLDLDFGDNVHGIFGATCGEPLHVFEMQLLELISQGFSNSLFSKSQAALQKAMSNIVNVAEHQSIKADYLPMNAFRDGNTDVKLLTGREKHAKLFAIYISMMCSDLFEMIARLPKKNEHHLCCGITDLNCWMDLIEDSLILMQWLKQDVVKKEDLYNRDWYNQYVDNNNAEDNILPLDDDDMAFQSKAQCKVIEYLQKYKSVVNRTDGNKLKLPKFHLVLHFVRNIIRHGVPANIDGSRMESSAKDLAKSPGLRTQKRHSTISFSTACRYHEDITVLEAERLYHTRSSPHKNAAATGADKTYSYFSSKKKTYDERFPEDEESIKNRHYIFQGSCFSLKLRVADGLTHDDIYSVGIAQVQWTGEGINGRIDDNLLYCIMNWLWVDPYGGTISFTSRPKCYTEMNIGGMVYRCHPSYRSHQPWNDWVYVDWGDQFDQHVPARLHLFLDTSDCTVISERESVLNRLEQNTQSDVNLLPLEAREPHNEATNYLRNHTKWAVVHSAESAEMSLPPSQYHYQSRLSRRVRMEDKILRIVPVECIIKPAFGFINHSNANPQKRYDNTAIIVGHPSTWGSFFLND